MNMNNRMTSRHTGLTLVELLVGLAVGMLLLLGVGLLFTQNKQSYRQNEELARLQEEARFALDELGRDISMAGFTAEVVDSSILFVGITAADQGTFTGALGGTVNCGPTAAARNWFYDFTNGIVQDSILSGDNVASGGAAQALFSCLTPGEFETGTDLIGIKRTSGVPSGFVDAAAAVNQPAPDGRVYVRENGARGVLFQSPGLPVSPGAAPERTVVQPFQEWEYTPRIYYIRNFGVTAGDGVPTLCRIRLVNDGTGGRPPAHTQECIAQGVEDLQLEFGLDTDEDGAANVYVTNPTPQQLTRTVSVRVYLLMRTINLDVGHSDDRTYAISNKAAYTPDDRFHRRIYASTVVVRNVNSIRLAF